MKAWNVSTKALSCAVVTLWASLAHAGWSIKTVDDAADAGEVNSISWTEPDTVHILYSSNSGSTYKIRYAKGPANGQLSKVDLGNGSQVDGVAYNGVLHMSYIRDNGQLRYAKQSNPGAGNCLGANFNCEELGFVSSPHPWDTPTSIAVGPSGTVWIAYRSGNDVVRAKRVGTNNWSYFDITGLVTEKGQLTNEDQDLAVNGSNTPWISYRFMFVSNR